MTASEALARANERLLEIVGQAALDAARRMANRGAGRDEINAELVAFVVKLEEWRRKTYRRIRRQLDEPTAPSVELH